MIFFRVTLLLIAVLFISCSSSETPSEIGQRFELMTITTKDITFDKSYSASIRGQQDIKVIPRVDGYLTDILIKEGQKVKKGQTLFVIDQVAYKAALAAAQATVAVSESAVANAKLNYNSTKALFDQDIVANFDLESAANELRTAEAYLMQAKAQADVAANNLSFTVISSPSDGVVGKIPYRRGDYVGVQTLDGLTVVADNSRMYVYFSMVERQIMDLIEDYGNTEKAIEQMPEVRLLLSTNSLYAQSGRVESISGIIDEATGSASLRAVFPNSEGRLLSGGAGSVVMPYTYTDAIVIPLEATYEIQNKTYVYKVVDGAAVSTIVEVDKVNNGKEYVVRSGLDVSDVIIAAGAGLVQEGTKISLEKE